MTLKPLKPVELRWRCKPSKFRFKNSGELKPTERIVGQDRAVGAVHLGLEIPSSGYNMFITGVPGSGRETTVKRILDRIDITSDSLQDICYVYNFEDASKPRALILPAGCGRKLKQTIENCVELLKRNIPAVLQSERTAGERGRLLRSFSEKKEELMNAVTQEAQKTGFALVSITTGPGQARPDVLPVIDSKPVTHEQLREMVSSGAITEEKMTEIRESHEKLFQKLSEALRRSHDIDMKAKTALEELMIEMVRPTVVGITDQLKHLGGGESLEEYADGMASTILENLETFSGSDSDADPYYVFRVNLLVDNSDRKTRPVVVENFPDPSSLFGTIDRIMVENKPYSDHTMISAGSYLKANGGFLILDAMDVVRYPGLWQTLAQTLKNQTVVIRANDMMRLFGAVELQPEPVQVNVKVIMIGPAWLYMLLAGNDPEFGLLFRIRADFDDSMELTGTNLKDFSRVIAYITSTEKLAPLDPSGMAMVCEQSARITGRNDRLSLQFNLIADYVRQAAYWASRSGRNVVTGEDVRKAISEKKRRLSLSADHALRGILDGQVLVDTAGSRVGMVNGLAVYQGVDYSFGLPARITVSVTPGREGLVNVERESEMSGPIHTKGVEVISGYLRNMFARDYPLSLSAGIVFEQSYGGVDGDSASSTELYALLSALSGLPVRQDLAVTGSVNQFGEIQPIGGVNEKIEGFFRVCRERDLTGTQGVLIPASNRVHLQLDLEVIEAVRERRFHIYPVSTVGQGIELLTGRPAGEQDVSGAYPPDSVLGLADRRLRTMAETLRDFSCSR
jgi:ATP-dependent Lon protease